MKVTVIPIIVRVLGKRTGGIEKSEKELRSYTP